MVSNLALNALPQALALVHESRMVHLPHPHVAIAARDGEALGTWWQQQSVCSLTRTVKHETQYATSTCRKCSTKQSSSSMLQLHLPRGDTLA